MATSATVPVQKEEVLSVLEALSFKDVRNEARWPDDKLLAKAQSLHTVKTIDAFVAKIADAGVKRTAELLVKAGRRGDTLAWEETEEVVETEAAAEEVEPTNEELAAEEEEVEVETEEETAEEESETEGEVEEESEAEEEPEPAKPAPKTIPKKKETTTVATQTAKAPAKVAAKTVPAKPAAKAPAKPAPAAKEPKAPKEAVAKDKFGMREGTRAARINAAIDGTPRTPKEICELANYDKTIHNHLKKLVDGGFVVVNEGKYSEKGATAKKAAAKPAAKPAAKAPAAAATAKKVVAKK